MEPAASDEDVNQLITTLQLHLDASITHKDTKSDLRNRPQMSEFLEKHTSQTRYFFSLKKCSDPCQWCSEPRLPVATFNDLHHLPVPILEGDHYRSFEVKLLFVLLGNRFGNF